MKRSLLVICLTVLAGMEIKAQTNTFPTSGNVGIGTTSPASALAIERSNTDGNAVNGPTIVIKNTSTYNPGSGGGYNQAWMNFISGNGGTLGQVVSNYGAGSSAPWSAGSGFYLTTRTNDPIIFATGAATTEKMRITWDGKVGIGLIPQTNFHVDGHIAASYGGSSGFVQLWGDNAIIWKAGNASGLRFGSANDLAAAGWSEKMRITNAGYVGIGTGSPSEMLEVTGNIKSTGFVLPTGAAAGKVLTSDASGVATWQTASSSSPSSPTGWTLNGSTSVASGYVTIGTGSLPASDALLAVKGNVYAQKVKVTQTGWSDYVFDPGYKLRPLTEVENYIQQQHHLPEVPSAAAVAKDGLDVGDNQATLLKKIEELTLYVIQQNKKQQEQQNLIEEQHAMLQQQQQRLEAMEKQLKSK